MQNNYTSNIPNVPKQLQEFGSKALEFASPVLEPASKALGYLGNIVYAGLQPPPKNPYKEPKLDFNNLLDENGNFRPYTAPKLTKEEVDAINNYNMTPSKRISQNVFDAMFKGKQFEMPKTGIAPVDFVAPILADPLMYTPLGIGKSILAKGAAKLLPKVAPKLAQKGEQFLVKQAAEKAFGKGNLVDDLLSKNPNATIEDVAKYGDNLLTNADDIVTKNAQKEYDTFLYGKTVKSSKLQPSKKTVSNIPYGVVDDAMKSIEPSETLSQIDGLPKQFIGDNTEGLKMSGLDLSTTRRFNRPLNNNTTQFTFNNPEIEATYKANKGIKSPSVAQKIKDGIQQTVNSFTRPISTLPVNKENAELYKELTRLPKIKQITGDDTIRIIDDVVKDLDKNSFDLFSRKVLLDDLAEEVKIGNALPNKFTPDEVTNELYRVNQSLSTKEIEALNKRKAYMDTIKIDYINSMDSIGIDVKDKFAKENYFRHQVLDYMDSKKISGTGSKLKVPANRGFSKSRSGEYTGNINTDYIQAEYEVIAQMKHDAEIAKTIKNIKDNYDISDAIKADAKNKGLKDWKQAIPEGYTTWQPKEGNVFYMADSIPSKVANQLEENLIKEWNLTSDEVTKILAVGGKRKEYVVKEEVANTLDNLYKSKPTNVVSDASKKVQSLWKKWVLTGNPKSVVKYNIRNFSGDLDPILTGNPSTLIKIPKASKELFDAMKNGKFTPELKIFYDKGGFQQLLTAQEIGDVSKLKPFERFNNKNIGEKIGSTLASPLKGYNNLTTSVTNYREMISRYAAYIDYLDQLKAGKLKNYGASKPEVINGLKSIEDKAFKLSNDLLGAYDSISETGQILRNHLIPFYSWMEVNMKRYKQLFSNALRSESIAEKVGKSSLLGIKVPAKIAVKVGTTALGAYALTGALSAWNQLKYPELEDTLPDDVKSKPHIILGKDSNGKTLYFSRLGALNDFLEWFGLDTAQQDIKDILDGKKTLKEQAIDMAKSPVNKIAGGISPFFKTPAEIALGKKTYPDVFKPSQIRDTPQYVAQTLGVKGEFDALTGKPTRPYLESLSDAVMYDVDPKESAFYKVAELKSKFKEQKGDSGEGFFQSPRSKALYNYKLALKYGDVKAEGKYLQEYISLGGNKKGMETSLESMDPLSGLSKKNKKEFVESLTPKEQTTLKQAQEYYDSIVTDEEKKKILNQINKAPK